MITRSTKTEVVKKSGDGESTQKANSEPNADTRRAKNGSPLHLFVCASGITSCYLLYGTIQEKLFHMDKQHVENGDEANERITLFLLATSTFSSFLLAWTWTMIGPVLLPEEGNKSEKNCVTNSIADGRQSMVEERKLNHPLIVLTSITYLTAMAASNESLHYVSYPTCVLAKSSKLIPTMIVGYLVDQWRSWQSCKLDDNHKVADRGAKRINSMEWVGAALITTGILTFQYIQLNKQSNSDSKDTEQGDSPYGLVLLGLSLFMDGLLGACQSALKQTAGETYRPPSAMETMLFTNLYATLILLPASYSAGQFQRGIDSMFFSKDENKFTLLMQLNLSASLGQVFVFLTIYHFSPLICTTITTTRKFFTILLSVYKFGHVLNSVQWLSILLVFAGLYLEIFAKLFDEHEHKGGDASEKKKQE